MLFSLRRGLELLLLLTSSTAGLGAWRHCWLALSGGAAGLEIPLPWRKRDFSMSDTGSAGDVTASGIEGQPCIFSLEMGEVRPR